jgi:sulfur carrier protein
LGRGSSVEVACRQIKPYLENPLPGYRSVQDGGFFYAHSEGKMNLTVNGKKTAIVDKGSLSISELLKELNMEDPLYVTVALNDDILERTNFERVVVRDGDEVEFLYFMGGGSGSC